MPTLEELVEECRERLASDEPIRVKLKVAYCWRDLYPFDLERLGDHDPEEVMRRVWPVLGRELEPARRFPIQSDSFWIEVAEAEEHRNDCL